MSSCIFGGFHAFMARLQSLIGIKSKSASSEKPSLQISAPFNFKHETFSLPGVSDDEIAILKEHAAASRLMSGAADPSSFGTPRKAPAPPSLRPMTPVVNVIPSTPVSPAENLI